MWYVLCAVSKNIGGGRSDLSRPFSIRLALMVLRLVTYIAMQIPIEEVHIRPLKTFPKLNFLTYVLAGRGNENESNLVN